LLAFVTREKLDDDVLWCTSAQLFDDSAVKYASSSLLVALVEVGERRREQPTTSVNKAGGKGRW